MNVEWWPRAIIFIKVCEHHHSAQLIATWNLHLEQWIFSLRCFLLHLPDVFSSWWWEKPALGWRTCWFPVNKKYPGVGDCWLPPPEHNGQTLSLPPWGSDLWSPPPHGSSPPAGNCWGRLRELRGTGCRGADRIPPWCSPDSNLQDCLERRWEPLWLPDPSESWSKLKLLVVSVQMEVRAHYSLLTLYRGPCSRHRDKCRGRRGPLHWSATSTCLSRPCRGWSCPSALPSASVGPGGRRASPPPPPPPPPSLYTSDSAASPGLTVDCPADLHINWDREKVRPCLCLPQVCLTLTSCITVLMYCVRFHKY